MKDRSDMIGNKTRDFPACSAVSQPTEPSRTIFLFCPTVFAVSYFVPLGPSIRVVLLLGGGGLSVTATEYIND
jgi:hypothetical protein